MIRYRVPESERSQNAPRSAFGTNPTFRNLRLFLDVESFALGAKTPICWYAEDKRLTTWTNCPEVDASIVEHLDGQWGPYVSCGDQSVGIAHWETKKPVIHRVLASQFHEEIVRKLPALTLTQRLEGDAFVTDSDALFALRDSCLGSRMPLIISSREAIALTGLYLRFRHEHSVRLGPGGTATIGRLGYADLIVEALVPRVQFLGDQSQAIKLRLARAMYSRDRILRCYFVDAGDYDLADEAFFYLDALLVSLVATFDLVSRHAHTLLAMEGSERYASWGRDKWRDGLKEKLPGLHELTRKDTATGATISLCSVLRNYVHGMPLEPVDYVDLDERASTVVLRIPTEEQMAVFNSMSVIGGDWNVLAREPNVLLVDVPYLADRLLGASLVALDLVIREMHPNQIASAIPSAAGHLPTAMQPRFVEACRLLVDLPGVL